MEDASWWMHHEWGIMEEASLGTLAVGYLFLSPHLFRSAVMPDVGARFGSNGSFSLRFCDMRHHFVEQLRASSMQTIAFASYLKAQKYFRHFVPCFIFANNISGQNTRKQHWQIPQDFSVNVWCVPENNIFTKKL